MTNINELLRNLEDTRAMLDDIIARRDTLKDEAMPLEVKQRMAEIDEEFESIIASAQAAYAEAESTVKSAVFNHGATVKGQFLQAVWSKPRITWDAKALDGYALNHPELFAFRTEGKPSVSIRVMK